eukprot:COSAG02_NODE_1108_length_14539_cov_4.353393_8_plen_121_part_00
MRSSTVSPRGRGSSDYLQALQLLNRSSDGYKPRYHSKAEILVHPVVPRATRGGMVQGPTGTVKTASEKNCVNASVARWVAARTLQSCLEYSTVHSNTVETVRKTFGTNSRSVSSHASPPL